MQNSFHRRQVPAGLQLDRVAHAPVQEEDETDEHAAAQVLRRLDHLGEDEAEGGLKGRESSGNARASGRRYPHGV